MKTKLKEFKESINKELDQMISECESNDVPQRSIGGGGIKHGEDEHDNDC